jgi:hypothetical protein
MNPITERDPAGAGPEADAELATLHGGLPDPAAPYPLLVEPWEEGWDTHSELDAQIFAGLLRLAP